MANEKPEKSKLDILCKRILEKCTKEVVLCSDNKEEIWKIFGDKSLLDYKEWFCDRIKNNFRAVLFNINSILPVKVKGIIERSTSKEDGIKKIDDLLTRCRNEMADRSFGDDEYAGFSKEANNKMKKVALELMDEKYAAKKDELIKKFDEMEKKKK